jgi:hypothetical protein
MAVRYQLVIDCADPDLLARFWAAALGYEFEPPPAGFAAWDEYWRDLGLPEADLGIGEDRIIDPEEGGPRIWIQVVPESKTVKNRLHLDSTSAADGRSRSRRAGSESTPRRVGCVISVPPWSASRPRRASITTG